MASYSYVDTSGALKTVDAPDAATALKSPDIAAHSGVILNKVSPASTSPIANNAVTGSTSSPITGTSGTSRVNENNTLSYLNSVQPIDTSYIDQYEQALKASLDGSIGSINSSYDSQESTLKDAQAKDIGTESATLARAGGYLGNSGSAQGVLLSLSAKHRAEIADLESKRQAAIQAAKEGYNSKAMQIMQERAAAAKQYTADALKAKSDFFSTTQKLSNQNAISSAISNGAKSPQAIFDALGGKVSISDIHDYLTNAKDTATTDTGAFKYTQADMAKLLGSGFTSSDISSISDYVNTHGYTNELRNTLTPRERNVLDSIYYPKTASTPGAVGGSLTIAEAKSLGLPVSIVGRGQAQIISDLSSQTPPKWYQDYVTSQWADPSAPVNTEGLKKLWDEFRIPILQGKKTTTSSSSSGIDFGSL